MTPDTLAAIVARPTDELERLAAAALEQVESGNEWDHQYGDALSELEAAVSPDVVLALLADRRALLALLRETRDIMQAVREDSSMWWIQPRIGSGSIEERLPSEAVHFSDSMTHLRVYLSALDAALDTEVSA